MSSTPLPTPTDHPDVAYAMRPYGTVPQLDLAMSHGSERFAVNASWSTLQP
jgi:hypothetical protein